MLRPIKELTAKTILEDEVFDELFDIEDEIDQARRILDLEERARELEVWDKFKPLLAAAKRMAKKIRSGGRKNVSKLENWTNFDGPYDRLRCRDWIADDSGIYLRNPNTGISDILACYHPILPLERLRNVETGEEQVKIAFCRNNRWEEFIVPKPLISSANKIVSLSSRGVAVTSENAKFLVRYLADVENSNEEYIPVQYSTSKLGWTRNDGFLPYDSDIVFDGDARFRQIAESIGQHGDREAWYEHARKVRSAGRFEVNFMLAAAFSSILVKKLGALPYFVDLWGETEGGKTVCLMLAASVWANPDESAYIKDYKGTEVGLEAISDLLNHLPLILDDTSKKNRRIEENFEGLVYDLCSGKGKTRSNKEIGLNRESHWKNCILTNGERPLNSYVSQGGAINRILEVQAGSVLFDSPRETAETVKKHYGFAGRDFVELVRQLGDKELLRLQKELMSELMEENKMQKQALSLSVILMADKLITEHLFKDGQYLSVEEAKTVLIDRNELSDNERCYEYLIGKITMNPGRFDLENEKLEMWGVIEGETAFIQSNAFEDLCKSGGFSRQAFLKWAKERDMLDTGAAQDRYTKNKRINGRVVRTIALRLRNDKEDEFVTVKKDCTQEELPFS